MFVGDLVQIIGPLAEVYPGAFLVQANPTPGVFTLSNGEEFHFQFLRVLPRPPPPPPRTATPVEVIIPRLPISVWKSLKVAAETDNTVRQGLKKLKNAITINLDAQQTVNWVAYLVTKALITQAQADTLLA